MEFWQSQILKMFQIFYQRMDPFGYVLTFFCEKVVLSEDKGERENGRK